MNRRAAFSLTELLVLIPLIALVGTLVLASLGDSKQTVQAAACLNNMRQWGLAIGLYCNDYQDFTPDEGGQSAATPIDQDFQVSAWFNVLPPYFNQTPLKDLYHAGKIPLPGMRSIWICPSIPPGAQGTYGTAENNAFFAYAMNRLLTGVLSGDTADALYKRSVAAVPSQVILFSESEGYDGRNWDYPFTDGGQLNPDSGGPPPRHNGGMNFVFVDGHAEWEPVAAYKRGNMGYQANTEWVAGPWPVYWFPCKSCNKSGVPRW